MAKKKRKWTAERRAKFERTLAKRKKVRRAVAASRKKEEIATFEPRDHIMVLEGDRLVRYVRQEGLLETFLRRRGGSNVGR